MSKIIQIASYCTRGVICLDDEGVMRILEDVLVHSAAGDTAKYVKQWTELPPLLDNPKE